MYNIKNLLDNSNIRVATESGPVRILEHVFNYNADPSMASQAYRESQMNVRKRQALIALNNSSFTISAGAMQWTIGDVKLKTNVKGVGDFVGKLFKGAVTGESAVKPEYYGTGFLMLEPTYKHLLLVRVEEWGGIVLEDGFFLGCENGVQMEVIARTNLKSALAGSEGLFNLCLTGNGVAILESPVPYSSLVEVELQNDEMRIDGSMAVAWTKSLDFTVEKAASGLLATAASGEGLVNVYRGTGKILLDVLGNDRVKLAKMMNI